MTAPRLGGFLAVLALGLLAPPALAQRPVRERAEEILREGLTSEDLRLKLFALERAVTVGEDGLEEEARHSAESSDHVERSLGLELLAGIDVAGNRDVFLSALDSPYRPVRLRTLKALGTLSDPDLSPRFVEVLEKDADPDLQALAARNLGRACPPEGRASLRRAVAAGRPVVQTAAVRSLVALGDLGIGLQLVERARSAEGKERTRLLGLVAFVPDADLAPLLGGFLEDPDPEVRVAAATAILSILEPAP